jgi:hypothetical protein
VKSHNKEYNVNRSKGNEQASTVGRQLTIVVTKVTEDTVYYRLLSSSNPRIYHWTSTKTSPLQPNHFQIDQPYGINTLSKGGKYVWVSTFPLMTYDKYKELKVIDQDTLINLLDKNDYRHITDLYSTLVEDFEAHELTSAQMLFIEDVDDLTEYWQSNNDFRHHFLPTLTVPTTENNDLSQLIDSSGLFS